MVSRLAVDLARIRSIVGAVVDPEIPALTIEDLGILRRVEEEGGRLIVIITPTYSGCPAMRQIEGDIIEAVSRHGLEAEVRVEHNPPWTTEWMTDEGNRKLAEFGIAPPTAPGEILCPRCGGPDVKVVNLFGSTACKALMVCSRCREPFDYFKRF